MHSITRLGKYACLELERRYLLRQLPPDLLESGWQIHDRYITGTRLRLRRMAPLGGGDVLYKFGQKYRAPDQSAVETTMTNMYLNVAEYERLSQLDAAELTKTRYHCLHDGRRYGIDVFENPLQGLLLAEIECQTMADVAQLPLPSFAVRDVTGEPFFTGGNLMTLTREAFRVQLRRWL